MNTLAKRIASVYLANSHKVAGGSDFQDYVPIADPKRAFQEARTEAQEESGSRGYTGTIAEKFDYVVRSKQPMSLSTARAFAYEDVERNDKWGPAFAVPVAETVKGATTDFEIEVRARDRQEARTVAEAQIKAKAKPGMDVSVQVSSSDASKDGSKPTFEATKGTTTEYWLGTSGSYRHKDKKSASDAAKFALASSTKGSKIDIYEVSLVATIAVKEEAKKLPSFTVKGKVTVSKKTDKIVGWLFYGIASS